MQEAAKEKIQVALMGPPRVTYGDPSNKAISKVVKRINAHPDALELLALMLLSLLTARRDGFDPLALNAEHEADRVRLVAAYDPQTLARDPKRARDNFSYVLRKVNDALKIRKSRDGLEAEHAMIGITLVHLGIDLRRILDAARKLHEEKNQDLVIAQAGTRLLEGMDYPWLDEPAFRDLRRALDDCYLDALLRKIAGLRVKMESAVSLGDLDQAEAYRSQGLPLIEQGRTRLRVLGDPHPGAARFTGFEARFAHLIEAGRTKTTPGTPAHNIPRRVTSFVGRDTEMKNLAALLSTDRIVTVIGIGGCGKTRLALQACLEHADRTGDEAWLVELAGVADPALVPQAIAQVLNLPEPKQGTYTDALVQRFRTRRAHLLMDNCEHLLSGCAPLAERLVQSCPDLTVLATSREPLNIEGEYHLRLKPLRVPPTDPAAYETPDPVATLLEYAAARLFVDRIRLHNDFPITADHVLPIASICAGLDGIPLALELAAARAAALTLPEIGELLTDRFQLLTGGKSTSLPRHKTLRAVIDWSYDLLTEREKTLLCRLSAFAGGWTLEGARWVGTSGDMPESEILDLLTSLIDKSLITRDETASDGRYGMLETIRQYADDRLRERGMREETCLLHWTYYLHLAEESELHFVGPEPEPWLDRLDTETENLRAALSWLLTAGDARTRIDVFDQAARMVNALGWLWTIRGRFSEGRQWTNKMLETAAGRAPSHEMTKMLDWAGKLASRQCDYPEAVDLLERALAIVRQIGAPVAICRSLNNLAITERKKGDSVGARLHLEECLEIARSLGDWRSTANALTNLGTVAYDTCDYLEARQFLEESLAIYQEMQYFEGAAYATINLGFIADCQGSYETACDLLKAGLARQRRMGNVQGSAEVLIYLGINACNRGDYRTAGAVLQESKAISEQIGDRQLVASALNALGFAAYDQNDLTTARSLFQEGRDLYRQIGVLRGAVASLHGLGLVACDHGDSGAALALFRDGIVLADRVGDKLGVVNLFEGVACAFSETGQIMRAARLWGASACLREQIGAPMPPNARERQEAKMQIARAVLENSAFDAAVAAGRLLTIDQIIQETLKLMDT